MTVKHINQYSKASAQFLNVRFAKIISDKTGHSLRLSVFAVKNFKMEILIATPDCFVPRNDARKGNAMITSHKSDISTMTIKHINQYSKALAQFLNVRFVKIISSKTGHLKA